MLLLKMYEGFFLVCLCRSFLKDIYREDGWFGDHVYKPRPMTRLRTDSSKIESGRQIVLCPSRAKHNSFKSSFPLYYKVASKINFSHDPFKEELAKDSFTRHDSLSTYDLVNPWLKNNTKVLLIDNNNKAIILSLTNTLVTPTIFINLLWWRVWAHIYEVCYS